MPERFLGDTPARASCSIAGPKSFLEQRSGKSFLKGSPAQCWNGKGKQGAMSCPVGVVQLRLRTRLTEKKSAQVHCSRETEALVFLLAGMMTVTL